MKIAFISDIHANLPALEAVMNDIQEQKPDMVFCLGDLVGYAPWPNEVCELIRAHGIPAIAGNYDEGVGKNSNDCGCAYKTEQDKELGARSIIFTNEIITEENRAYLNSLPRHLHLQFKFFNMIMVHGSPRRINEYLFQDRPDISFINMIQQQQADVMLFGHTHKPFHKIFQVTEKTLHAINTGSVGKPKDADPRACYVLLEFPSGAALQSIQVSFRRVSYNVEKAVQAIKSSPLPNEFAQMLENGG